MSIEAMKQALKALELAKRSYGVMLLSDPPQDAWKTRGVNGEIDKSITSLRQAIAEAEKQDCMIEIEFLDWVHPRFGVMPAKVEGDKPLVLRAKIKENT